MIIYIIGNQLVKLKTLGQRHTSNKLLGRIFSKFNISKIVSLSERGLHNFITLIVTLACSCDLTEFGSRLIDILFQIQYNKLLPERQKILAKGHLAMLILFAENQMNFGKHIERLSIQMKENVGDQMPLWSLFASAIKEILSNMHCIDHGGHLLIGNWIHPYMNSCNAKEKHEFLEALNTILRWLIEMQSNKEFLDVEKEQLLKSVIKSIFSSSHSMIKQQFLKTSEVEISLIPEAAALLTSLAKGKDGIPKFEIMLNFFGDVLRPNVRNGIMYYNYLSDDAFQRIPSQILVQNWIKFELLYPNAPLLMMVRYRILDTSEIKLQIRDDIHQTIKKQPQGGAAPLLFFKSMFEIYYKLEVNFVCLFLININLN